MKRKHYIKPLVVKLEIDNSISLVMMTVPPNDPNPRPVGSKGTDTPFSSPFDKTPFN